MTVERVLLAEPRGFCAGVEMAIKALTWMTRIFEPPVYCYHEIVHNEWVVRAFERVGVVFVNDVSEVPVGAPVMLSAHGSAPQVIDEASERAAVVIDADGALHQHGAPAGSRRERFLSTQRADSSSSATRARYRSAKATRRPRSRPTWRSSVSAATAGSPSCSATTWRR